MLLMALLIMFDMSHVSVHGAGKHIYLCTTIGGISVSSTYHGTKVDHTEHIIF